jgi:hypothetical protein
MGSELLVGNLNPSKSTRLAYALLSAAIFLALAMGIQGAVFWADKGMILTGPDMSSQIVPWFSFEAREFSARHVPLWNPFCFCGSPFVAEPVTACFYPFHWLLMVLPLAACINVLYVLHYFLAGWLTCLWCRGRGISYSGSILAGMLFSLCGPFVGHESAGHLCVIEVMAWAPAIFLCIDKIFDDGGWHWGLLGMAAVALSILTGFGQLNYYTGLLAGLYSLLRIVGLCVRWIRQRGTPDALTRPLRRLVGAVVMLLLMYAVGGAMSAIQLMPTISTTPETVRKNGLSYEMASSCPVPPEGLFTLIAPDFMGGLTPPVTPESFLHPARPPVARALLWDDVDPIDYYGRWYPWEVISFIGVGGLALAAFGAVGGRREARRFMAVLAILSAVLMLGKHTPVYKFLYDHLPMYGSFRSANRFNLPLCLFIAILAGAGLDGLLHRKTVPWTFIGTLIFVCLILCGGWLWLRNESNLPTSGRWGSALHALADSNEATYVSTTELHDDTFVRRAGLHAAQTLVLPMCLFGVAALVMFMSRYWRPFAYLLAIMAAAEVFLFAWRSVVIGSVDQTLPTPWLNAVAKLDPDGRIISTDLNTANLGMQHGYPDAYGYDPFVLSRYADFLAAIQTDLDPALRDQLRRGLDWAPPVVVKLTRSTESANQIVFQFDPRLVFLRARNLFAFLSTNKGRTLVNITLPAVVKRLMLVSEWRLKPDRDQLFAVINEQDFDITKTVVLESPPDPLPSAPAEPGTVSAVDIDSDRMEITADTPVPQILLITDSFARDWRARPLSDDGGQANYQVLAADYLFRAIPLTAGHHHFILEYLPKSFVQGRRITLATLTVWVGAWILLLVETRRRERMLPLPSDSATIAPAAAWLGPAPTPPRPTPPPPRSPPPSRPSAGKPTAPAAPQPPPPPPPTRPSTGKPAAPAPQPPPPPAGPPPARPGPPPSRWIPIPEYDAFRQARHPSRIKPKTPPKYPQNPQNPQNPTTPQIPPKKDEPPKQGEK